MGNCSAKYTAAGVASPGQELSQSGHEGEPEPTQSLGRALLTPGDPDVADVARFHDQLREYLRKAVPARAGEL